MQRQVRVASESAATSGGSRLASTVRENLPSLQGNVSATSRLLQTKRGAGHRRARRTGTPLDFPAVPRKPRKRTASPSIHTSTTLRRSGGRSYQAHRDWLLAQHGPVCAYCGVTTSPETITLDHVRPRKGQTAYDRPDNLVLACSTCNAAKADMPFLAFLLARRSRGVYLLHYGDHLSEGIKEIVRQVTERPLLPPD